jgi:hypothetical protein
MTKPPVMKVQFVDPLILISLDVTIGETLKELITIPLSKNKENVVLVMLLLLFLLWKLESESNPKCKNNLSFQVVELLDVLDTIKDVMEVTLFWLLNTLQNLDSILNNANHIKIMMFLVNMNAIKKKYIELMNMVMLVKDIMEVLTKKLCKKKF